MNAPGWRPAHAVTSWRARSSRWLAALLALLLLLLQTSAVTSQFSREALRDYRILNGHFFTQAAGDPEGKQGFRITDENGVKFASEFVRLGGVAMLGYPITRRFIWDGFVTQATQKAVLQWRPEANRAALINLLDAFSDAGLDAWLEARAQVPRRRILAEEQGLTFAEVVLRRLRYLDASPVLAQAFESVPDPLELFGLPTAPIVDLGPVRVLRTQRAVLQEWQVLTRWASPGQVTLVNAGQLALEAGLIPRAAAEPESVDLTLATLPTSPVVRVDDALLTQLRGVVAQARSAVVELTDGRRGNGSGVLYDPSGLILTNYHVVAGLDRARLRAVLADGRSFSVQVLGADDWTDLAVVQIKGDDLPVLPLGNSAQVRPGDWVVGLGYGAILPGQPSAKAGRVASVSGQIQTAGDYPLFDLIQSDVFLYPGDSGGPLLNVHGEVIGLNTAIRTSRRGQRLTGFSIPVTVARQIAEALLSPEGVPRPWFGITVRNMTPRLAIETGHQVTFGIYVSEVRAGSPAAAAGLRPGSVMIQMDGQPLEALTDLRRLMIRHKVGDRVSIVIVDPDGWRRTLQVQFAARPSLA